MYDVIIGEDGEVRLMVKNNRGHWNVLATLHWSAFDHNNAKMIEGAKEIRDILNENYELTKPRSGG